MRILITGVNGFVGAHLSNLLRKAGDDVWGLSADVAGAGWSGGGEGEKARIARVDILDQKNLTEFVNSCDPRVIIHLAGLSHVGASWKQPGAYYNVNFVGTSNVLAAAAERKVIFASSSEVYGVVAAEDQPLREDRTLDPRSPYAITKACAEAIALDRGAVVVRSFNAIGPGQAPSFAMPSFALQLARIAAGSEPPVLSVGNLAPRRDFLHVEDIVRGYETVMHSGERAQIYNLASGEATSIASAVEMLIEVSGIEAEVEVDPGRERQVDIPLLCGDSSRLQRLGWKPRRNLREAVADLWATVVA